MRLLFLLLCAGGTRVGAQGVASSFDQLGVLVKPGDKISLVDVTGREAEGRIAKLSRDTLTLATEAGEVRSSCTGRSERAAALSKAPSAV